jgi:hypothetical protein
LTGIRVALDGLLTLDAEKLDCLADVLHDCCAAKGNRTLTAKQNTDPDTSEVDLESGSILQSSALQWSQKKIFKKYQKS